jgi:gas vesicle protein
MNNESPSTVSTALVAFAGGALVGAGLALLFAPQSGRKTRRQIGGMAEDAEDYAQDLVQQAGQGLEKARQKGEQWLGQAKDIIEEKKAQAAAAMDGARR